jgi:hypothetical protein
MAVDAMAINPLKTYKFRLELNGLPAALIQSFNPGDRSHGMTEHAGAGQNHTVKEVGMVVFGNCSLGMVVPMDGPGRTYFDDWMQTAQNTLTGNGEIPAKYRRNFTLYELDPRGDPSRIWEFKAGFPVRMSLGMRNAVAGNSDVIEELEITYCNREMRIVT